MIREQARTGMKVVFGRSNGEKTLGKIIDINPKKALVETLENRGRGKGSPIGSKWRVPYEMMEPENEQVDKMIGVTFHSPYQDADPEWKVVSKDGHNYLCKIINCPDYEGTQKVFMPKEIEKAITWQKSINNAFTNRERFYDNLQLGDIIHYHNGFNNWVRCEVVTDEGIKKLLQKELVGDWKSHDLPRRVNGTVQLGHAQYLGQLFRPDPSNLFEGTCKRYPDPRNLPAINLDVPPPTQQETQIARLWKAANDIQNTYSEVKPTSINNTLTDPTPILQRIREILNELDKGQPTE